jgi:hypothetical protein
VQGVSGVQGINGEFLISNVTVVNGITQATTNGLTTGAISETPSTGNNTSTDSTVTDRYSVVPTDFRRFQDISFDQYGYFAQGANLGTGTTTPNGGVNPGPAATLGNGAGYGSGSGQGPATVGVTYNIINATGGRPTILLPPASAGNLFVADLGTGLSVSIPVPNTTPAETIRVPVQGPLQVEINNTTGTPSITVTPTAVGLGGRIVRITPLGQLTTFAQGFHTTNALDSSGFAMSSLSLTFSADGTTLYVADDDAIWQFKTVASLAGSDSGSLIGLNDLRSLGVPYDGQGAAVAVIDTGVDANSAPFRGRVAPGFNVFTGGAGNDDTAVFTNTFTNVGGTGGAGGAGGAAGGAGTTNPAPLPTFDGHGTTVAGVVAQFVPQATIVPINIFAPFLAPATGTAGGTTGGTGGTTGTTGTTTGVTVTAAANALTDSQFLWQGLNYVSTHPFVNDPVRPGQVDRVIAAVMGFGTTETFASEVDAYHRYPQIVISLKNQMKRFHSLGIAPIAAAGQFGAPFAAGVATSTGTTGTTTTTAVGAPTGQNNSENANVGDVNGISMPAILNEVVSVTGSYPYPFSTGPGTPPTNPPVGIVPRPNNNPILIFGNSVTIGGGAVTTSGGTATGATPTNLIGLLTNADFAQYSDRMLGAANRNVTTDFVAPAVDVPTFRRTFTANTTAAGTLSTVNVQDPADHNAFNDGGTSLSAAEVTGAFALVSSALTYWSNLAKTGVTSDAYLTQPVGVDTLNFGKGNLADLTAWNNPDGINAILQWTAVPASDPNDGTSVSTPLQAIGSPNFRNYSRLSVGNAIAAIEGYEALTYLIKTGYINAIDPNANGIITAQELQNFEDNATANGLSAAGAMARLLGGTARISSMNSTPTLYQEFPDQPDILQRRFNFFDYAADGILNGSVTVAQLNMLVTKLLPEPDAFVIHDRQKSSVNGYLLAPAAQRNYHDLLHILPKFQFVAASNKLLKKYRGISPSKFHVQRGLAPSTSIFPVYTLYDGPPTQQLVSGTPPTSGSTAAATTSSGSGTTAQTAVAQPLTTTTTQGATSTAAQPSTSTAAATTTQAAATTTQAAATTTQAATTTDTTGTAATSGAAVVPTDTSQSSSLFTSQPAASSQVSSVVSSSSTTAPVTTTTATTAPVQTTSTDSTQSSSTSTSTTSTVKSLLSKIINGL